MGNENPMEQPPVWLSSPSAPRVYNQLLPLHTIPCADPGLAQPDPMGMLPPPCHPHCLGTARCFCLSHTSHNSKINFPYSHWKGRKNLEQRLEKSPPKGHCSFAQSSWTLQSCRAPLPLATRSQAAQNLQNTPQVLHSVASRG